MASRSRRNKKYFTLAEANATLPLVRSILRDVTELAQQLRDRHERLVRLRKDDSAPPGEAYNEELEQIEAAFARDREQMESFEQELRELGIELKDYFTGLIDFPALMDGREVYLCWRLGEAHVAFWHELDAGFAGRQPVAERVSTVQ
jgi:hypothetical protein